MMSLEQYIVLDSKEKAPLPSNASIVARISERPVRFTLQLISTSLDTLELLS